MLFICNTEYEAYTLVRPPVNILCPVLRVNNLLTVIQAVVARQHIAYGYAYYDKLYR